MVFDVSQVDTWDECPKIYRTFKTPDDIINNKYNTISKKTIAELRELVSKVSSVHFSQLNYIFIFVHYNARYVLNNTYGNNLQPIKSFTGVKNTWNNSNNNLNNQNVNSPDFSEIKPTEQQENILSGYVTNGNNAFNNGKSILEGYITNTPDVVETEQQDLPTTYWDSKGNAQKVDENGNPIADTRGLWQKVSDELTKSAYNIDNRINRPTEDQQKRDTELLLALLTSPLGGEYAAAKLAPKLVPYLGKQVAKSVMTGLGSGVVGGGAEGLSWGLHEGENPFISMTRDALLGGLAGAVGGYGFGKVNKAITDIPRKKELEELLAKQKVWGIPYRSASGNPEDAIDVLYKNKQGFVPKAYQKGDDIDFVWGKYTPPKNPNEKGGGYGLAHIEGRRNEEGYNGEKFLRELPELLNKGNKYYKENHTDRFYIGNDEKEAAIKMLYDKNFWKWLTSAYFK